MELEFKKTCDAFPEQYDVFHKGEQVGYVRIRWGKITVSCPDVGGKIAYHSDIKGFGYLEDDERQEVMNTVIDSINQWMSE